MKFEKNSKMTFLMMLFSTIVLVSFSCLCFQGSESGNYLLLIAERGSRDEIGWTDVILANIDRASS